MNQKQKRALQQLKDIAEASAGALQLTEVHPCEDGLSLYVDLTLDTQGFEKRAGGIGFRRREPLRLRVYPTHPFRRPDLDFRHIDHAGKPHVNWARRICLFQSPETEWNPSDGLYGFFSRVDQWFKAAAAGQLDPELAPLHPPAVFPTESVWYIAEKDTPEIAKGSTHWLGRAVLEEHSSVKYSIIDWQELDADVGEGTTATSAILLDQPLAFEYPDKVSKLFDLLEAAGVDRSTLNTLFIQKAMNSEKGQPFDIVIGSPMRRRAAGETVRQHLSVWRIPVDAMDHLRDYMASSGADDDHVKSFVSWSFDSTTAWCRVLENRPEIIIRRDHSTPASWLEGKSILLLGAGALGGAIAEDIVRAGASTLHVLDNDVVTPGVLVRQRFAYEDIARAKSISLAKRLNALSLGCEVEAHFVNVIGNLEKLAEDNSFDLIIDATASRSVAYHFEDLISRGRITSPVAFLSVSARAEHGMAMLRMPGFDCGPIDIARRVKLAAFSETSVSSSVEAFWPKTEAEELFQPEPGCSDPTFVGSAIDVGYHASGLMNLVLNRIRSLQLGFASCDTLAGPQGAKQGTLEARSAFEFPAPTKSVESIHGYELRVSRAAEAIIASELSRSARVNGPETETGGLLFGEVDEALEMIWLDAASHPPSDSEMSPTKFLCGTEGTSELAASIAKQSKGSSSFIGIWHTHPISRPDPSADDMAAMVELLLEQEKTPRHVLMMIVGFAATNPTPEYYLYTRRDIESFLEQYKAMAAEVAW